MTITEPGLVYGMDEETYHGDPVPAGSLSSSLARQITKHVPAKAIARHVNRQPTKSMNLGKAAHAHALGAGPELIVWEYDGRTKDGKAERAAVAELLATEAAVAVTQTERAQVLGMAEALLAHKEVAEILAASEHEVSAFWAEDGTWCRSRYDILLPDRAYDYKTTQDASTRGFSKAMASYGYHQQAEFYMRGLAAIGHLGGGTPMSFICQESEAPYLVQVHTPDDFALELARSLNDRAVSIYAQAKKTGVWPGYPQLVAEPTSLPTYYFYDNEDAMPDAWRVSEELVV